jgi:hypothetical protein
MKPVALGPATAAAIVLANPSSLYAKPAAEAEGPRQLAIELGGVFVAVVKQKPTAVIP